jgi:argininosuccinate lyase
VTLWGGGFEDAPDAVVWDYTASTTDRRLLSVDIAGSVAHVKGLDAAGILPAEECAELLAGLRTVAAEVVAREFSFEPSDEDVHTAIERRLGELIGPVAGKLHTARSRNDQVALDLRLYLMESVTKIEGKIRSLVASLVDAAEAAGEAVAPSFTHLQHAQAVPFAHGLLAHAWALSRDLGRFDDLRGRLQVSPLGAGAGGGSRFALEPEVAATELRMGGVFENSLDAVAARDQATEYAWCGTQTFIDLSRLSEEIVLWCSREFGWMELSDRHATGSSALPQKKNPDAAELTRGKAGSAIGRLTGLLSLMKGLPLSYNRDMQEDKELVFSIGDDLEGALDALVAVIDGATFSPAAPSADVTALDLAEVLVERGVPFREAHNAVGGLVAKRQELDLTLAGVTPDELSEAHSAFEPGDELLVDPVESVKARRSPGGGSFDSVRHQIAELRELLSA